jgi:hypothetical protein
MKRFILPFIVLAVVVINIGIFGLRISSARAKGIVPQPGGKKEEMETMNVLARKVKARRDEVSALLKEAEQARYKETGRGFTLQGILHDDGGPPLAIINDRIVREGDEIEGAKVIKINKREVVLLKKVSFTIKLTGGANLRLPGSKAGDG